MQRPPAGSRRARWGRCVVVLFAPSLLGCAPEADLHFVHSALAGGSDSGADETEGTLELGLCDGFATADLVEDHLDMWIDAMLPLVAEDFSLVRPHRPGGHVFSWNVVDPQGDGAFDFTLPDRVVAAAQDVGVELLVSIYPRADPDPHEVVRIEAPASEEAYLHFVTALVERYDGDGHEDMPDLVTPIQRWEVGNEPDTFNCEPSSWQAYADLVKTTASAVRASDTQAVLYPGGVSPLFAAEQGTTDVPDECILGLVEAMLDAGVAEVVSGLNFHSAVGTAHPDIDHYFDTWSSLLVESPAATGLELVVTETGVCDVGGGPCIATTPEGQVTWLRDHLQAIAARSAGPVLLCNPTSFLDNPDLLDVVREFAR